MKKFKKNEFVIYTLISFLFSLMLVLKKEIGYSKGNVDNFINNFHFDSKFFLTAFVYTIIVFIIIIILFLIIDKIKINGSKEKMYNKKIILISFICIFISGLLFRITFFPGSGGNDTLYIIGNPIGMSVQHPLFYNLVISYMFKIFYFIFNSNNLAYFFTSIMELIFMSIILTYIIWWVNKTFCDKRITIFVLLYYVLLPIISDYNSTLYKDSIFNIFLLIQIPILYSIIKTKGKCLEEKKTLILFVVLFSMCALVRNNGLYVLIFMITILIFTYKKYYKKLLLILLLVIVIAKIPSVLLKIKNIEPLFQEQIGVPLEQISYVIKYGDISKEDKEYFNKLLPIQLYKQNYDPFTVDLIKWDSNFNSEYLNETKGEFIKRWFKILPNNLEKYVKSYLLLTYHTYTIEKLVPAQSVFFELDLSDKNSTSSFQDPKLVNKTILPNKIQNILETFYKKTTTYFNPGLCFWILIFMIMYLIHNKKSELIILTLPLLGTWITLMIAAPISFALRYFSACIYIFPLIFIFTFLNKK